MVIALGCVKNSLFLGPLRRAREQIYGTALHEGGKALDSTALGTAFERRSAWEDLELLFCFTLQFLLA